jgi:hopene-associated glycosyltransferase HpnB
MLALPALIIWLYLCLAHGRFWSSTPQLAAASPPEFPDIDIIVPARDEAGCIGPVVASLLSQDYGGRFRVILVDDNSTDGTADVAAGAARGTAAPAPPAGTAEASGSAAPPLTIIRLQSKPPGWSGKLWALSRGIAASSAPVLLFTDADIVHDARHLSSLTAQLLQTRADMVSEMVHLNCESWAERALIPAFVYFFQMLYPFSKVNDPRSRVAAAAGGTVLIRREALQRIGGIDAIKGALIDDVALAQAVKQSGKIYLGHSALAASIRPYPNLSDIWSMVSRTAFTQLRHSALLLLLTLLALALVWWVPAAAMLFARGASRAAGSIAFVLSCASYLPTLKRYGRSGVWAFALPLIAFFYMAATVASALNYWRGRGALWKARAYRSG